MWPVRISIHHCSDNAARGSTIATQYRHNRDAAVRLHLLAMLMSILRRAGTKHLVCNRLQDERIVCRAVTTYRREGILRANAGASRRLLSEPRLTSGTVAKIPRGRYSLLRPARLDWIVVSFFRRRDANDRR